MANRIVLNTVSYHGKGALGNIVPELTAVCAVRVGATPGGAGAT